MRHVKFWAKYLLVFIAANLLAIVATLFFNEGDSYDMLTGTVWFFVAGAVAGTCTSKMATEYIRGFFKEEEDA